MDYSERKLTDVSVYGLQGGPMGDGTHGVNGGVSIKITAMDGSPNGPNITVDFAVTSHPEVTIVDAEKALLTGALALLKRLSLESPESLLEALSRTRKESFFRPTDLE